MACSWAPSDVLHVANSSSESCLCASRTGQHVYHLCLGEQHLRPTTCACAAVLLACRLNAAAVFHCTCSSQQAPALAAIASSSKAADSHVSGPPARPDQQHISCSFCQVLSGLIELDVCGSTALSAHTLARLLRSCSSLRRLGVAGCKTLGVNDGVQRLEAGLLSIAQLQHVQQQQQGQAHLSAGFAANRSSLEALPLEPEPPGSNRCYGSTTSSSWHPPVCTVGGGLQRLCVGWGWSAAAISCVLRGSPFLVSFTAGGERHSTNLATRDWGCCCVVRRV